MAADITIELALHPDDVRAAGRLLSAGARVPRARIPRPAGLAILWHDTASGDFAARGLAIAEIRRGGATEWRLSRLVPEPRTAAPAGVPETVLATAATVATLGVGEEAPLLPVATFMGDQRRVPAAVDAQLITGELRGAAHAERECRLTLSGPGETVLAAALELAGALRAQVARQSLAVRGREVAAHLVPPRPVDMPELDEDCTVGDAFALVCARLGNAIQHHASMSGQGTEPVHQMRVALRRLRSAIALFRRAADSPALRETDLALRDLGRVLGPARDWDVFVTGTGRHVAGAFPADPAVQRLVAAAARRRRARNAALHAYIQDADYRRLGIRLACLVAIRPWEEPSGEAASDPDGDAERRLKTRGLSLKSFAAHALRRRLARLLAPGADIAGLPEDALHAIRLQAKRMRYSAEIFALLFPRRATVRFIRRLATLQERLGQLNDAAVAAALMAELGKTGGRGFAAGVVCGYVAAGAAGARARIERSWHRLQKTAPFWE